MSFPSVYLTPIFNILMIFVLAVPYIGFYLFKKIFKRNQKILFWQNIFTILCVSTFTCISNILYSLMSLMNCKDFGSRSYLSIYMLEDCSSYRYLKWLTFFIIPVFCLFAVLLPCLALFYMLLKKKDILERKISVIGFLINGFSRNKYYWYWFFLGYLKNNLIIFREIILFARRILLVLIVSSIPLDSESKALFIFWILILFILLNFNQNPFYTKNLNALELNQCFTIILIILCGFTSLKINNDYFSVFTVVFVFLLNIQFLFRAIKSVFIFQLAKIFKFNKKENKKDKKSKSLLILGKFFIQILF